MTILEPIPISQRTPVQSVSSPETRRATLVSVVVPCFNEADSIRQLKARLIELSNCDQNEFEFEFVIVDDGSTDGTFSLLVDEFGDDDRFRIARHNSNKGLTAAILTGSQIAQGEWIVSIDSDCTYHPNQIFNLLAGIDSDVAMIIGSPYHRSGKVLNVPNWRISISKCANRIYRFLFRSKLSCYTSCFRAIRKSHVQKMSVNQPGFVGMTELVWRVEKLGGRVIEIPAVLDVRRYGQSKLRLMRVVLQHLKFMARVAAGGR